MTSIAVAAGFDQGTKPRLAAPKHKRRYKVTDRLPLEEIYDTG